jgi:hypothetical protein
VLPLLHCCVAPESGKLSRYGGSDPLVEDRADERQRLGFGAFWAVLGLLWLTLGGAHVWLRALGGLYLVLAAAHLVSAVALRRRQQQPLP